MAGGLTGDAVAGGAGVLGGTAVGLALGGVAAGAACAIVGALIAAEIIRRRRPAPATATGSRRRVLAGLGSLLVLVLLVLGAATVYQRQADQNWRQMSVALDTFPTPAGYTTVARRRWGSMNCAWNPSCQAPRAELILTATKTINEICADLRVSLRSWPIRSSGPYPSTGSCGSAGMVHSVRFWVDVSGGGGDTPELAILVAPTISDENIPHL